MQTKEIIHTTITSGDTFVIEYYAKKYNEIISRRGSWLKPNTDTKGKHFIDYNGKDCYIYWDFDATPNENGNKWRHAKNPIKCEIL